MGATRVEESTAGRRATEAHVGLFELQRIRFAARHSHGDFEPDRPYVAIVLDGSMHKLFPATRFALGRNSFATLPAGAVHSTRFGREGTDVLVVRSATEQPPPAFGTLLRRCRHVNAAAPTAIGWRIARELHANDASWPLAVEGLVLQLLAAASRATDEGARRERAGWLAEVRELLHERTPARLSLCELADAVGVHPTHLARSFRREYGQTVAEYARALRLDWASAELAAGDASLADVALGAGFADQSHFTRAFRRHTGVTRPLSSAP